MKDSQWISIKYIKKSKRIYDLLKNQALSYVNLSAEGDRFVAGGESKHIYRQKDGAVPRADKFT